MTRRDTLTAALGAVAAFGGASAADGGAMVDDSAAAALRGPIFNQDSTDFFFTRPLEEMTGEGVDAWVDDLAAAGVGTVLTCVCAMCANYASAVWEPHWARCDPSGSDSQSTLAHLAPESRESARKWVAGMARLAENGVHFHERAYARCRRHGMGAWATIRMNDLHDCDLPDSPLLSSFYIGQRERGFVRAPHRMASWQDRALDWGREDVRDHYMALVREVLGFEGIEGLELDWMRFGWHFRPGRELEGGEILTEWIREVRGLCQRAGRRAGRPIRLGCRTPSSPQTARTLGLDGARWAREGLIDLLVPTPFWNTCEFAMPIATWRQLLAGTRCALAGGLEIRCESSPGGPLTMMTPDLARGAATAVLADGADHVYLFNYFARGSLHESWTRPVFERTLSSMRSLGSVSAGPRRHAVTFRDIVAPGEEYGRVLPAESGSGAFRLHTGPRPAGRRVELLLELRAAEGAEPAAPAVWVNSVACPEPRREGAGTLLYAVPDEAMADRETLVEATGGGAAIVRVELAVAAE